MATIKQVLLNWENLNFEQVIENTFYESEKDIIYLNVEQMQSGKGSDDNILKNRNKRFNGVYKPLTQEIASKENPVLSKNAGELYNFGWTGDFLANMNLEVSNLEYSIFSTGTGTGLKKAFFDGYNNMFGLNKESRSELIDAKGFQNKLIKNIKNVVRL
jgi:hypothetical protein